MNVTLVRYTNEPQEAIELAAANCYNSKPNGKIMKACYESGHKSVLEFAQFHFHIEGISRACANQLVRHRTFSFAQESQRFCSNYGEGIPPLPNGDVKSHQGQRFYDNQERFIAQMYNKGYSTRELSDFYGGDIATIHRIVTKYIQPRNLSECKGINKEYFKTIDNPVKAYILGMFYSDGCLSVKKNGLKQIILDQLKEEEVLLLNILHEIKPDGQINKDGKNSMVRIAIQDNELCTDLESYGIVSRKGVSAKFDNILQKVPDKYIKDVIRGIFEGDGHTHIIWNKQKKIRDAQFYISGTYDTCKAIQSYLMEKLGLNQTKIRHHVNKCYVVSYGGRLQVTKILGWLYSDVDSAFIHARKAKVVFELFPNIKKQYMTDITDMICTKYNAVIPNSILQNIDATNMYILTLMHIKETYKDLQKKLATTGYYGERANEDARFVLPNACCTTIDVSCDFRNLAHFMNERLCRKAQWEIRELAQKMRQCVVEVFPEAASMLVPKCEMYNVHFCTEKKPCGRHIKLEDMLPETESDGE